MKKLLNLLPIIVFSVSCNVVQMIMQDDGKVPDDFYVTNVIPYPNNMLAQSYAKVKNYINIIDNTVPVGFAKSNQDVALFAPVSFNAEWSSSLIFSNNDGNSITAQSWVSQIIRNLEIIYSNNNKYDSPTNRILKAINTLCAGGLILAKNLPDLGEFDIPASGTYEVTLDNEAIYALALHCDITETNGMEGQNISISISTPTSTTIYDLEINFMGSVYYLRYTSQGMAIAALESFDNDQQFHKVLIKDDLVSNGLAIEFIEGPTNATVDDNETHTAMRIYYDSVDPTGLYGILYKETYDSSIDSWVNFFIGGYYGSGGNLSLSMRGTYFSNSADERLACISPNSWSIVNDGQTCAASTTTIAGIYTNGSADIAFENFYTNWVSSYSFYSTLDDQHTPGFSTLGNMGTSSIYGTTAP